MGHKILAGAVVAAMVIGLGAVTVAAASAASSPTFAAGVERAPYVTDVTGTSADVNWATDKQTAAVVQYADESTGSCPSTWTAGRPTATAVTQSYTVTATEHQYSAELTGLQPGHSYCYVALSAASTSGVDAFASPTFQTVTTLQPASANPVSFDVIGDTGENFMQTGTDGNGNPTATPFPTSIDPSGVNNPYESALYSEIGQDYASGQAQFLLGAGDLSYNGGSEDTLGDLTHPGTVAQANGPGGTEYSNIFGPSYLPLAQGIPTYLSDGNHGQNANALKAFPMAATAANSGGAYAMDSYSGVDGITTTSPDVWYAFSTGGVRIYVLDAAWSTTTGTASSAYQADVDEHWQPSSAEMTWLQGDLSNPAYAGQVKMAVFHYPLVSLNNTEFSDTALANVLDPVLAEGGVSLVFNGHAHTYQRIRPTAAGSIPSYVTGGGGGVPEPVDGNGDTHGACAAEKQVANVYAIGWSPNGTVGKQGSYCGPGPDATPTDLGQAYSYLHVSVSGGQITVNGVNADGQSFDLQTYGSSGGGTGSTTTTTSTSPGSTTTTTPPVQGTPPGPPCALHLPAGTVVGTAALPDGSGYYEVDSAGDVAAFGGAKCYGAMTGTALSKPVVGMAVDPVTGGYWLVATDGGIFSFNAPFEGSTGAMHLNRPVVGMTASPDGQGYWFVASDGGIFSFGDAAFYGSTGSMHLNMPVVGMAAASDGHGYWLVASDGGIFAFGSAGFFGSTGALHLNQPIVNMEATGDGRGYRLIASDGGVFDFGSAPFYGSAGSIRLNRPMIGGADDNATGGYWLIASDGGVFTYNAPFLGSAA